MDISYKEFEKLKVEIDKVLHEKINIFVDKNINIKMLLNNSKYIENYIKWYFTTMVSYEFRDRIDDFKLYRYEILNLIEKMAVWYELRFPSNNLNRLLSLEKDKLKNEGNTYNYDLFYNNLNYSEKDFLQDSVFSHIVYFSLSRGSHVHLDSKGYIIDVDDFYPVVDTKRKTVIIARNGYGFGKQFKGKHLKEVQEFLLTKGIRNEEVDNAIRNYDNSLKIKEGFLNSVMFRIIERDNINGSKRAFLFAKEFDRNIDIPMMYAPSEDNFLYELDDDFKKLINAYLKAGGTKDLECIIDYVPYLKVPRKIDTISLSEIISKDENFISLDEKEIKLIILKLLKLKIKEKEEELGMTVDEVRKLNQEEVYQKRISRRLKKSLRR